MLGHKPKSLLQTIAEYGGIADVDGELASRGVIPRKGGVKFLKKQRKVAKKDKKTGTAHEVDVSPDYVREHVVGQGFLDTVPEGEGATYADAERIQGTLDQLYDAIAEEYHGDKSYSADNEALIREAQANANDALDQYARAGIDNDMSVDEIASELHRQNILMDYEDALDGNISNVMDEVFAGELDDIESDLSAQLALTGKYDDAGVAANAAVGRAYYHARAARLRTSPLELYKQDRVHIESEMVAAADGQSRRYNQFVGEEAIGADVVKLDGAKKMLDAGISTDAVRYATGWFQGWDGKWRYEISDKDARLKGTKAFEAYGFERDIEEGRPPALLTLKDELGLKKGKGDLTPAQADEIFQLSQEALLVEAHAEQLLAQGEGKLKGRLKGKVGDYLHHPKLYAAYPWAADIDINLILTPDAPFTGKGRQRGEAKGD